MKSFAEFMFVLVYTLKVLGTKSTKAYCIISTLNFSAGLSISLCSSIVSRSNPNGCSENINCFGFVIVKR